MGVGAMAFFNAVSSRPQQQQHAAPAPPLAPPLGVGPGPGSRSARRHYQQHVQQQQQLQLATRATKQQPQGPPPTSSPVAGPSRVADDQLQVVPQQQQPPVAQPPPAPSKCPCTVDEFLAPFRNKMKAFKKLKKRLATRSSSSAATNNLPPLTFHQVHGENIELCYERRVARRNESFCKAVTFSNRPVLVGEKVYIRFLEISDSWSGVIRMGFTSYDPVTLAASSSGLPRYACPDLTNKPGSWAKALSERFATQGAVLYFYVTATGDVHFGVNGEDKGFFFGDVETRGPLWAVIDVYGNSTAIELVDPRSNLNNSRRSLTSTGDWDGGSSPERLSSAMAGLRLQPAEQRQQQQQVQQQQQRSHQQQQQAISRAHQRHHGHHHQHRASVVSAHSHHEQPAVAAPAQNGNHHQQDALPQPRFQPTGAVFSFLAFHRTRGRNVVLNHDRTVANRPDTEFCHGYVFTQRPVMLGERIVVQVLNTEPAYVGALAFGLTSCDPSTLGPSDLPEDADFLLDRSEYWVVSKDVASAPQRGDELTFSVTHSGEVTISRNGSTPVVFMHVDHTLQLWAFLDVYGSTQRVRLLGSLMDPASAQRMGVQNQSSVDPSTANSTNNGRLACCAPAPAPQPSRPPVPPHAVPATVTVVTPHPSPAHVAGASGPAVTGATAEVLQLAANGGTMLVVNLPPNPHTYLPGPPPAPVAAAAEPADHASAAFSDNGAVEPSVQQWMGQYAGTNTMSGSECSICYERPIDSVLYMCGHMCMCFECAVQQWRGKGGGHCPMCRAVIRDVIRTYKS